MAYRITRGPVGGQPIATNSTVRNHTLGQIVHAEDSSLGAGEFIYLKGVASTVVGSWVRWDSQDWSTALTVQGMVGPVAVAMSACVANEYGWYQISGQASAKAVDVVDSGAVYLDTLVGHAKDAVSATHKVSNALWTSADDTSVVRANVKIFRPFLALESNDT